MTSPTKPAAPSPRQDPDPSTEDDLTRLVVDVIHAARKVRDSAGWSPVHGAIVHAECVGRLNDGLRSLDALLEPGDLSAAGCVSSPVPPTDPATHPAPGPGAPKAGNFCGDPLEAITSAIASYGRRELDGWELELVRRRILARPSPLPSKEDVEKAVNDYALAVMVADVAKGEQREPAEALAREARAALLSLIPYRSDQ